MTAAIWKIVISPYLSCESSELHEILYADTNFTAGDGNDKNQIRKFKMADVRDIKNHYWL